MLLASTLPAFLREIFELWPSLSPSNPPTSIAIVVASECLIGSRTCLRRFVGTQDATVRSTTVNLLIPLEVCSTYSYPCTRYRTADFHDSRGDFFVGIQKRTLQLARTIRYTGIPCRTTVDVARHRRAQVCSSCLYCTFQLLLSSPFLRHCALQRPCETHLHITSS